MPLVFRTTGDCRHCGEVGAFGNIGVYGDHVLRGCKCCEHREQLPLPSLSKKIVYLDQSLLSSAYRGDDVATALLERVKELAKEQLLVAPYSSVHEDETALLANSNPEKSAELLDFIRRSSGGHKFRPAYDVQHRQLFRAFKENVDQASRPSAAERSDALGSDVDRWTDYLFVDVEAPARDVVGKSARKQAAVAELLETLTSWRASALSFDEIFQHELSDAGFGYIRAYERCLERASNGDLLAFLNGPRDARVIEGMVGAASDGESAELVKERCRGVLDFFSSSRFSECPYQWISARMFAVLRHQVRAGQHANEAKAGVALKGHFSDIEHIATYAPYCDAIYVDGPMANILNDGRLRLRNRYDVQVFSRRSLPDFYDWLDALERTADEIHRAALTTAYPE